MKIDAFGPDGVRELRLFSSCRFCGSQTTGFTIDSSAGLPDILLPPSRVTLEPCGHTQPIDGRGFVMYAFAKDTEGKKAYNAKAIELAREARRTRAEAGNPYGMRL